MFIANILFHSCLGQLFGGKTTSDAPQPCFPKSCLHAELENLLRKIMPSLNLVNSRPWRCRVFSDSVRPLLLVSMSSSPIVASFLLFTLSSDGIWMLPLSSTSPLPALPVLLLPLSLLGSQLLVQDRYHHHHGLPAYSHNDRIPPWWGNVSNDKGGNVSVSNSHHTW